MVPCSRSSSAAASVTEEQRRPDPPHHTHTPHGHCLPPPEDGSWARRGRGTEGWTVS